jgi:hypothetical protein
MQARRLATSTRPAQQQAGPPSGRAGTRVNRSGFAGDSGVPQVLVTPGFEPHRGESSGRRDGRAVPGYHGPAMSRPARVALAYTVILTSVEVE